MREIPNPDNGHVPPPAIDEYIDGELSTSITEHFEEHISQCRCCRTDLRRRQQWLLMITDAISGPFEIPEGFSISTARRAVGNSTLFDRTQSCWIELLIIWFFGVTLILKINDGLIGSGVIDVSRFTFSSSLTEAAGLVNYSYAIIEVASALLLHFWTSFSALLAVSFQ